MSREEIFNALFNKVAAATTFKTSSRRLKHWNDVPAVEMPAIFQLETPQVYERQGRGLPAKKYFNAELFIYVYCPNSSDIPSTQINNALDAIETVLAPDPATGLQSLGGLVMDCWIKGTIEIYEGLLGDKAVVILPIEILVNK